MDKQFEILYTAIQFYYYDQISLECVEMITGIVRNGHLYAADQLLIYAFNLFSSNSVCVQKYKLCAYANKEGLII